MKKPSGRTAAYLLACLMLAACGTAATRGGPRTVQPGAPGEATRPLPAGEVAERPAPTYTEADVAFIRGMLPHHAQALEMTALVPGRTASEDIRRLAERIEVSQTDEIAMMRRWLESRGLDAPEAGMHRHHGAAGDQALMPGMLTREQLDRLAAASGAEFDRLFLEFMISHHEGALVMVEELFSSPGGGQTGEMFQIASEIAADQRIEIERMRAMLAR